MSDGRDHGANGRCDRVVPSNRPRAACSAMREVSGIEEPGKDKKIDPWLLRRSRARSPRLASGHGGVRDRPCIFASSAPFHAASFWHSRGSAFVVSAGKASGMVDLSKLDYGLSFFSSSWASLSILFRRRRAA